MSTQIKTRRGTAAEHTTFTGAEGELTVNTTNDSVHVHDGTTAGGHELARADGSNLAMESDLSFGDNDKAIFGAGNDLQIYHDPAAGHSQIREGGTGNLYIAGTNLILEDTAQADYLTAVSGGAVTIHHAGSPKLATTSTGIDVTGTATMDGLTVDGSNVVFQGATTSLDINPTTGNPNITIRSGNTFRGYIEGNASGGMTFGAGPSALTRQTIASNGDISFYEDTGTTAKFFWDSSAERLGIGTSSPSNKLNIKADGSSNLGITINGASSGDTATKLILEDSAGTQTGLIASYTNNLKFFAPQASGLMTFATGGTTERMRIDASGNLLVAQSSTTIPGIGNTTVGHSLHSQGYAAHSAAQTSLYVNRNSTDGNIIELSKDGTTVGSIGSVNGDLIIGNGDTGLFFNDSTNQIHPYNITGLSGGSVDGAIDLGQSGVRFKDLYLSGGVYLGGTGSANYLDDYEEGTFTPALTNISGGSISYTTQTGNYIKIGNKVTAWFSINIDTNSNTAGNVAVTMPFSSAYSGGVASSCGFVGFNTTSDSDANSLSFYSANNAAQISSISGSYMLASQVSNGSWVVGVVEYFVA